jgi:hypothetical protein
MIAALVMGCAITGFAQNEVNFTALEGYASIALDGQNGWATEGGWTVDSSGSGSVATTTDDVRAVYGGDPIVLTGVDNAIRIRTDFTYSGTPTDPSANTVIGLFGVSSVAVTNWAGTDADGTFLMLRPEGTVVLRYNNNTANLSPTASLVTADIVGDDLAIEYTLVLGSDAASSVFQAKLINVTDATETALGSYTGLEQNVFDAATTTGLNPMMWPGLFSINGTGITGVTVTKIAWEALEVLSGVTIDFVNPPYIDGELNNQEFWNAQAGMIVDTNATTVTATANFRRAISGQNPVFVDAGGEGDSATIKADFYFDDVLPALNKARATFGFTTDYNNSQKIVIRTTPGGTLELRNDGNTVALGSIPIPGTNDPLRITYTLTLGPDASTSTMQAILHNTVNGNAVTGSYSGIASAFYTAATTTNGSLRFRYNAAVLDTEAALVLDQVNFTEATAPAPPAPEGCVDFTNPPYVDGELNGQQFWGAQANMIVDTAATTVRATNAWRRATYGGMKRLVEPGVAAGDSATVTADFYFEDVLLPENKLRASFGFTEDFVKYQKFFLRSTAESGGILRLNNDSGVNIGAGSSIPLPGTNDLLQISVTLTLGTNALESVMSATLSNTVSGAFASGSYTGISSDLYTAATDGSGFWFSYANGEQNIPLVLDQFCLEESIANPLSGFDLFVQTYGLDGSKTADGDLGGLNDWGEYVFGGIPTDSSDDAAKASLPTFDAATGDYTFALIGDDTVVAHVLTTEDLLTGPWGTSATVNVTATDGVVSNYTENVGTAADNLFIQLFVE